VVVLQYANGIVQVTDAYSIQMAAYYNNTILSDDAKTQIAQILDHLQLIPSYMDRTEYIDTFVNVSNPKGELLGVDSLLDDPIILGWQYFAQVTLATVQVRVRLAYLIPRAITSMSRMSSSR
jgi:hypothetical protein